MVSPEIIRRYPFFAGLNQDYLVTLAKNANEERVDCGHRFFKEGDELNAFYLVLEGAVSINIPVPDPDVSQALSGQLTGQVKTKDMTVSTVGSGDVLGWSALIPPTYSTAGATSVTPCRVITFDCRELLRLFEEDRDFGFLMVQKAAQVIRQRLRDMRIESLAFQVPETEAVGSHAAGEIQTAEPEPTM
jgi:CRP/FNR family cyclic AMP-dependent transcriptional regulator